MLIMADVQCGDHPREISLKRLAGIDIVDIRGYLSKEFGEPCFKVTRIEFANKKFMYVEGEHDFPYVTELNPEVLQALYNEKN